MRRLVRSKADAVGVTLLALFLLGGAVLALLGYDVGLRLLFFIGGFSMGWTIAYLLTKPRRYRIWVSVSLGLAVLFPLFMSLFAPARGFDWLALYLGFDSAGGAFFFGSILGAAQVIFNRFMGRGFWDEDGVQDNRRGASR